MQSPEGKLFPSVQDGKISLDLFYLCYALWYCNVRYYLDLFICQSVYVQKYQKSHNLVFTWWENFTALRQAPELDLGQGLCN